MPIDYSKYPTDWKTRIRPDILERDGHKCKFCGLENYATGARDIKGNWHSEKSINGMNSDVGYSYFRLFDCKIIKIILTVAHLDHDIENNNYDNLAALCQKCHLNHDKEHHRKNGAATRKKKKGLVDIFEQPK